MSLRFRDLIAETVHEYSRMGDNFVRIYPARNSKMYDKYLSSHKALNRIMYKVFYTSEILPYDRGNKGDQTAQVASKKAKQLEQQKSSESSNRLHSSSGVRPMRQAKSNQKLSISNTMEDSRHSTI